MGANLMTLCALTRLSEIDDIHLASMTTAEVAAALLSVDSGTPGRDGV